MKKRTIRRLAIALAAAAVLGTATTALSLEISATTFVTNLDNYVMAGELAAAKDALMQLQRLGVQRIKIGEMTYDIDELIGMMSNPEEARIAVSQLIMSLRYYHTAYFESQNRVIASVNWAAVPDLFPTGSAG